MTTNSMRNPLDIEQEYHHLLFALSQPAVSWHRAMRIVDFLEFLLPDAARYESYVLDALDHLYPVLKAADASALPPDELRRPLQVLNRIRGAIPQLADDARFAGSTQALRTTLCLALSYVGDLRAMIAVLVPGDEGNTPAWLEEMPEHLRRDRRAALLYAASRISQTDPFTAACLRELLLQWKETPAEDVETIRVPVVELGFGNLSVEPHGVLRRVTLRITGSGSPEADRLETAIAVYGAETIGHSLVEAPVAAARQLLNATSPRLRTRTMSGVVTLDQHPALHEGDSAGLAIAALFFAAALRQTNQRILYRLHPNVAMTGVIDPDGGVRPVNPASLIPKTRAVFFSQIDTLVVPREQLAQVEAEVASLTERFPGRRLEIVGVSHLREVFYDLRVIRQQVVPRSVHLLRGAWRRRAVLTPAAVAAVLTLILMKLLVGPIDRNPTVVEYRRDSILLKNRYDETLSSLPVGPVTCGHARTVSAAYQLSTAVCEDVDADGRNEVIFIEKGWQGTGGIDLLRCWSPDRQAFLWQYRRERSYTFREKPEAAGINYMMLGFRSTDLDADGSRDLLLVANHSPSFPGVLTVVDPAAGTVRSEYLHAGNIMDLQLVDVDDDGVDEVVACAVNNAFNRAALLCLEGTAIRGHSPFLPAYRPDSMAAAGERCYVLIPRTVVGESFRSFRDNNSALAVEVGRANREISLSVDDGAGTGPAVVLNFMFGYDFRLRHIAQGDTYDAMATELVRTGVLQAVPDRGYFEGLRRSLRYWTGTGWSADPAATSVSGSTGSRPASAVQDH